MSRHEHISRDPPLRPMLPYNVKETAQPFSHLTSLSPEVASFMCLCTCRENKLNETKRMCAKPPCFSCGLGFPSTGTKWERRGNRRRPFMEDLWAFLTWHQSGTGGVTFLCVSSALKPLAGAGGAVAGGGWQGLLSRNLAWESRVLWWARNDFILRPTGKGECWRKGRECLGVIVTIWCALWGVCFTYY